MADKKEVSIVIARAKKNMQSMLKSVYDYNSTFIKTEEEKLLIKILFTMSLVDRRFFVSESMQEESYWDSALPIGKGQTISQPSTVARILLLANLKENDSVLEVGAGSGWNSTLISFLVYPGNVISIDRINALVEKAKANFKRFTLFLKQKNPSEFLKFSKLNFSVRNIFNTKQMAEKKYDKIIFTAGILNDNDEIKLKQVAARMLKQNGILICPYVSGPIIVYIKEKGKLKKISTKEHYVFVPLLEGIEK